MVIRRELRQQEAAEVSERHTIISIYRKFVETGSVEDRRIRSRRSSTITDDRTNEVVVFGLQTIDLLPSKLQ